ncbi:AraC family transcriptional regulator [soil metagenome]
MLVFGWRTAILLVVSIQVAALAIALARTARNRLSNRILAALLAVFVGLLTPFTIGFAGFYDRWPWLSFAPFAVPLAVGPLVYGYTVARLSGAPPRRFWLHLAPAFAQFLYQSVCFALPLATKNRWDDRVHAPFIDPAISLATLVGLAVYSGLALRRLRLHRATLGERVSDEQRHAAAWLGRSLVAVMVTLGVWGGYQGWQMLVRRLTYFDVFGLYLVLAALALYLAVEGWRHADLVTPASRSDPDPAPATPGPGKDWRTLGEGWAERTRLGGWWRDPDLSLPDLAARLGVNTTYLSRGLNDGLGVNFAGLINGLRARAVADALAAGRGEDLLTLALEAGFNSKASFNRAFKAQLGVSPSAYRRAQVSKSKPFPPPGN